MKSIGLYIHLPWCVRKCPYCDFNSYAIKATFPEQDYIRTLQHELLGYQKHFASRSIESIFFGGGTPSLFSEKSISSLLHFIHQHFTCDHQMEITLEANPGTVEQARFEGFLKAGVTRLSIGIQSFNDMQLKTLGRIHSSEEAKKAITIAKTVGFNNINLDLMFGLPNQ